MLSALEIICLSENAINMIAIPVSLVSLNKWSSRRLVQNVLQNKTKKAVCILSQTSKATYKYLNE